MGERRTDGVGERAVWRCASTADSAAARSAAAGPLAIAAALSLAVSSGAHAQDGREGGTGRETGFVAVSGPAQESVPGGVLVVAAYALVLGLLGAYVLRLGVLQARTQRDLERLERAVNGTGAAGGASAHGGALRRAGDAPEREAGA
jgi:hypothetical protein